MKKICSVLMAIVLILGMTAMPVFADVNESYDYIYTSNGESGNMVHLQQGRPNITCLLKIKDSEENEFNTYCIDYENSAIKNSKYSRMNIEDSTYISSSNAKKIRSVLFNSYPYINKDEIISRSNINFSLASTAITATQLAIWHLANGTDLNYYFSQSGAVVEKVKELTLWYLSLPETEAVSTISSIESNYNVIAEGKVDIAYRAAKKNSDGTDILLTPSLSDGISYENGTKDSNGFDHIIVTTNLEEFDVTFSGTQLIAKDAFLYYPEDGRTGTQMLTGLTDTNTPISKTFTIQNVYTPIDNNAIKIKKLDSTTLNPIANVEFAISQSREFDDDYYTVITDNNGIAVLSDIEPGVWYIKEKSAPSKYIPMKDIFEVTVSNTITEVTIKNTPYPELLITKISDTGAPLAGAEFAIYSGSSVQGTPILSNLITNEQGLIPVENLLPGEYTIVETKAPSGYICSSIPQTVNLLPGQITPILFTNTKIIGNYPILEINKYDSLTNKRLAGAEFTIYHDSDCTLIASENLVSSADSPIIITNLSQGTYYIKETKAPNGYNIDPIIQSVQLINGQTTVANFYNTLIGENPILEINKYDLITKERLAGAEFTIYNDEDCTTAVLENLVSSADSPIVINNLPAGTYYIKETKAPKGYLINSEIKTIELRNGETTIVDFYNEKDLPTAGNYATMLLIGLMLLAVCAAGFTTMFIIKRKLVNETKAE